MVLLALAHLRCSPSSLWMASYTSRSQQQLRSYTAQGLANTAWALAHMGYKPPKKWTKAFLARCAALLPTFQPTDFSTIIWALATLDVRPSKAWLEAYLQAMDGHFQGLSSQGLTSTIWALGKLEHQPPAAWVEAFMAQVDVQSSNYTMDFSSVILHGFTDWAAGRLNLSVGHQGSGSGGEGLQQVQELAAQVAHHAVVMDEAVEEAPAPVLALSGAA